MDEKIIEFQKEISGVNMVLTKLVKKQNSSVFDELCSKINTLFNKISSLVKPDLTKEDRAKLIGVLKELKTPCATLSNYKEYLITVIVQNNNKLDEEDRKKKSSQVVSEPEKQKELILTTEKAA